MKRATVFILIAVAAAGIIFFSLNSVFAASGPQAGKKAPDFTLSDLSGNQVRLSDLKGKVVFLNFFGSWCPPCREEMPDINAFYDEYKSKDVVVLVVDLQEDPSTVKEFMRQNGLTFPVLLDLNDKVGSLYRVDGIPAWFFIDKNGFIKSSKVGATSKAEMTLRALSMQ